jgi:hypothetical protein
VQVESNEQILEKSYQYLHWLTTPHKAFNDMPVCPFIEPEIKKDELYLDIWYPSIKPFMFLMEDFYTSSKSTALFVCPDTTSIDWSQVERSRIQAQLNSLLRANTLFSEYKSLCLSPYEPFTAAGVSTRERAPYFMINVANSTHLAKSHKQLQKSSYFANFTHDELDRLKVKDLK